MEDQGPYYVVPPVDKKDLCQMMPGKIQTVFQVIVGALSSR